jgi:O-antigen biosynthesis protein
MSVRPTVTAIVATRNRPELLPSAVRSLVAAMQPSDQLIVVESGDSGAEEVIASLAGPVMLHLRSTVPGKSHKLNRAIEQATGEIIVITDDDASVERDWIDAMAAAFADPSVGIGFGPVDGLTLHREVQQPRLPIGDAPVTTWDYAHGASMAVRATAAWDVGGFDERLGPGAPAHGEEHDLLIRLWERGWRAVIIAAPAVRHIEWRDDAETRRNLLVYERGGGALLGAALRRHPRRWARMAYLRGRYQLRLLRESPFGFAALRAFTRGLGYGLRLDERGWLTRR